MLLALCSYPFALSPLPSKTKPYAGHELKVIGPMARDCVRDQVNNSGHAINLNKVGIHAAIPDQCVSSFKARDDSFRGIELNDSANVQRKVCQSPLNKLKRKRSGAAGGFISTFTFAETDDSWTCFAEDSPPLKTLPHFDSEQTLRDVAVAESAAEAIVWKEIAGRFQCEAAIEIESKPTAKAGLGSAARVVGFGYGRELCSHLVPGHIVRLGSGRDEEC